MTHYTSNVDGKRELLRLLRKTRFHLASALEAIDFIYDPGDDVLFDLRNADLFEDIDVKEGVNNVGSFLGGTISNCIDYLVERQNDNLR